MGLISLERYCPLKIFFKNVQFQLYISRVFSALSGNCVILATCLTLFQLVHTSKDKHCILIQAIVLVPTKKTCRLPVFTTITHTCTPSNGIVLTLQIEIAQKDLQGISFIQFSNLNLIFSCSCKHRTV